MMQKQRCPNVRVILVITGIGVTCLIASSLFVSTQSDTEDQLSPLHVKSVSNLKAKTVNMSDDKFWRTVNLLAEDIPKDVATNKEKVDVKSRTVNIMAIDTFLREAKPPEGVTKSGEVVVLLHGAAFKSSTWLDLGTIHLLAAMGHHVVALDLPGYGETKGVVTGEKDKYLSSVLTALSISHPVILSPSMSGGFSVPFLLNYEALITAYITVAPVGTSQVVASAANIKVPTLIIYGQKDKSLGIRSRDDLLKIPTSQAVELPNAGHPAYLDQPEMFHKLLYNFIKQVHMHKSG